MLGRGISRDDGGVEEDSQAPKDRCSGQSNMVSKVAKCSMAQLLTEQHAGSFSKVENVEKKLDRLAQDLKLIKCDMAEERKQQAGLHSKVENIEKKQDSLAQDLKLIKCDMAEQREQHAGLYSKMESIEKKLDSLIQAASLHSSEHIAPGGGARPTDDSTKTTGWLSSAKALIPWSPWMCGIGLLPQRDHNGKTEIHYSQPPSSVCITRGITTVTTVSQCNNRSNQVSNAVTIPTFMCQQPRTQPHYEMSGDFTRRSCGQSSVSQRQPAPPNISRDAFLGLAIDMFRQTQSAENRQLRLVLEDCNGNHMTTAVAQVNKEGHQIASKTQYVGDQTIPPYSVFDQSLSFQNLPPQITDGRRASYNGTNLTEKVIVELSKMLGHNWKTIGIQCLGFKADYLSTIEAQHKDVHLQIFYMIRQWSRNNGADGTIEQLSELLKESRDIDYDVLVYLGSLIKPPENTD